MSKLIFPKITGDERAVLISDQSSGIVLDKEMKYVYEGDETYQVFPSEQSAIGFIEENRRGNTHFIIYDKDKNAVREFFF